MRSVVAIPWSLVVMSACGRDPQAPLVALPPPVAEPPPTPQPVATSSDATPQASPPSASAAPTSAKRFEVKHDPAWAACHASPEASLAAIATGCAQATGLKPWGEAIEGESRAGTPASYPLRAKRGHCYRVFAQGDRGVKDLDVAIVDATGAVAAEDATNAPTVVLVADGAVCFDVDEAATVAVRIEAGKGKYAIQIWSDE